MCKSKEIIANKAMLFLHEQLQHQLDIDRTAIEIHLLLF